MSFRIRPIASKIDFTDVDSLTDQHYKDEVDIHNIIKKYSATGVLTHVNTYQGSYGNFAGAPDFHTAKNMIAEADEMFMTVPSQIRADMQNDPSVFVDFMQNPENREKIEAYGFDTSHLLPIAPEAPPEPMAPQNQPFGGNTNGQQNIAQNAPIEPTGVSGGNAQNTTSNIGS